jgi:hypothetical protein
MGRFLCLLMTLCLIFGMNRSVSAIGVNDFVAVADSASAAVYNPAGLALSSERIFNWEHRFTGQDLAMGWDDLAVYSVSDYRGCGALFFAYNQDLIGLNLYNRVQTLGYSYGWLSSENLLLGLSAKFSQRGIYSNSTGVMVKQTTLSDDFLIDFGLLFKPAPNWKIGFALHNIGRNNSVQNYNYQSTLGMAYTHEKFTAAAEIYDVMNEGDAVLAGSLLRAGFKYNITSNIKIHGVIENSISNWDYTGEMIAAELKKKTLKFDVSWYKAESKYVNDDTFQAGIGFTF